MHRQSLRRFRLIAALVAPTLAAPFTSPTTASADDAIAAGGLTDVEVQLVGAEEQATPPAPLTDSESLDSVPATPIADEATSYPPIVAPAATQGQCNCCTTTCCTKKKKEAATKSMKGAFAGLFYANNFGYVDDPCYDGPNFCGECLKDMKTPFGTISLGGETRFRYHDERNFRGPNGLTGADDEFWLSRQRLYADWRINDVFRIYGEVLDANSSGEYLTPLPIDENDMDITNLFVDVNLFNHCDKSLTLRLGRQELLYEAQRTVSPLDWANTRRTFEGVRGLYSNGKFSLDGFWTRPVVVDPKDADEADDDEDFFGAYATMKDTAVGNVGAYYLGYISDKVSATPILNRDFSYHTIGGRVTGATDHGMLYDFEGAYQFGENNTPDSHSAGFCALGIGRKLAKAPLKPTIWAWYDYASGEEDFDEVSVGDGGYHHLFPLAHKYNGFMDLFGRRNLHDINAQLITPLGGRVTMLLWYHYFQLAEDTLPYNVVMIPYNQAGGPAEDKELGHEIDILFNINLNPRNNVLLGYSHFHGGDYYDAANIGPADGDNDADFFYAQYQLRY